jgi:hypothetical protein
LAASQAMHGKGLAEARALRSEIADTPPFDDFDHGYMLKLNAIEEYLSKRLSTVVWRHADGIA